MSNRAERRSAVKYFRARAGSYLITSLTDDLLLIDGEPTLKRALAHWLAVCEVRRPVCVGCKRGFVNGGIEPTAYLFAMSPNIPGAASTSVFCTECWQTLPMSKIEAICTRLLRRLLPRGSLEPSS